MRCSGFDKTPDLSTGKNCRFWTFSIIFIFSRLIWITLDYLALPWIGSDFQGPSESLMVCFSGYGTLGG